MLNRLVLAILLVTIISFGTLVSPAKSNNSTKETYQLIIKSASIAGTKANKSTWDAFSGPDPFVMVGILRKSDQEFQAVRKTTVVNDSYKPNWGNFVITSVEIGDTISLQVLDRDLAEHDVIGEYEFLVTKKLLTAGVMHVSFGQVEDLTFVIRQPLN